MGVYFYRIYKDTQLQNMVDQTVENGDMMGTLQKMSNYDSRIKDIIENQDQYPKELLELLTANIETIEFVFDYPEKKDNLPATIVVIRQIKRCRFHQIKTGLSEHLTMG